MANKINARRAARLSAIVMTAVLFGMVALALTTVFQARSAIGDVRQKLEISGLHANTANEITLAGMFLANYLRNRDPEDLRLYVRATGRAFAYGEEVRLKGSDEDRAILTAMETKNADAIARAQAQITAVISGDSDGLELSTDIVTDVAAEMTDLAQQKQQAALTRADTFQRDVNRRSVLTFVAFAFGIPMIFASYKVTRYYERKDAEQQAEVHRLQQAALTDGLTGLANHRAFQEDLQREVARAARADQPLTVAMLDVDDFKEVNDSSGHAQGDLVLAQIAGVISFLRSQDRGYRVGGDEFALIMPETDAAGAAEALQRLRTSVANGLGGPTVSIGYSSGGQGPFRAEVLRDHADAALYEAKHRGKNQVVAYSPELDEGSDMSANKMQVIRQVLSTKDISMWFQPIFRIGSSELLAFEALLRLPDQPIIDGPTEAFEIAQHMGLSHDLDLLCVTKALDNARDLPSNDKLFINLDPATLVHKDFSALELLEIVTGHGFDPGRIVFEVTERTPAPIHKIAKQVDALRECGFSIALDDVGAGNAGLEMLRLIKFEYVKIDRSVIVDALNGGPGRAVILAIVAFARETGAFMIAEGIETKEMLESVKFDEHGLKQFWVQGVQGFLMGRPGASIHAFLDGPSTPTKEAA